MKKVLILIVGCLLVGAQSYATPISPDMKNALSSCMSAPGPAMFNTFKTLSGCVQVVMSSNSFDTNAINACNKMRAGAYLDYRTLCYQAIANKTYQSAEAKAKLQKCVTFSDSVGFGTETLNCFAKAAD